MTTKAQRELGISSNMSDEKLRQLFGGRSLQDIIKIKPVKGATQPETKVTTYSRADRRKASRGSTKNNSSLSL